MPGRILELSEDGTHLARERGFLVASRGGIELARVPLADLAAVIANAHGLSYTNNALVALAEHGVPFVLTGPDHNLRALLLPVEGHHLQARRFDAQIAATLPMRKRAWAAIVKAKLLQQAAILEYLGQASAPLRHLARRVRSGDPDNLEAQGARRYWTLLFGEGFRRDRDAPGINALLNYGYTVLRACAARAIAAAGLHPTVALHHRNEANALRLADDLIEPFRPLIDLRVHRLHRAGAEGVTREAKRALVETLYFDYGTAQGVTPLAVCLERLAVSLAQYFLRERDDLELPFPALPLDVAACERG